MTGERPANSLFERCQVLREIRETQIAETLSGEKTAVHSNIQPSYAEALYRTVLRARPKRVIEVGMAFGFSSLAILSALEECGGDAMLISIDPFQKSQWRGCGVAAVKRAGYSARHRLIEDFDFLALPSLLSAGTACEFAYIDGWHTFDHALLDWWYIDRMLPVGGIAAFNDCGWPAVDKAIRFVLTHRKYSEMDVGLPTQYVDYSFKREVLRRLTFGSRERWYRRGEDRYFVKTEDWQPNWDFFSEF